MKQLHFLIVFLLLTPTVFAQSISDFQSIGAVRMNKVIQYPGATHGFQMICQSGDPLSGGGTKGTLSDFTGFVPISGSSTEGYLCINSEFLDLEEIVGPALAGAAGALIPNLEAAAGEGGGGGDIHHN